MNAKVREFGRKRLLTAVVALQEAIKDEMPPEIVARYVRSVLERAYLYCPDELASVQAIVAHQLACFGSGICSKCGEESEMISYMGALCAKCRAQAEADDAIERNGPQN